MAPEPNEHTTGGEGSPSDGDSVGSGSYVFSDGGVWMVPRRPLAARGRIAENGTTPARMRLSFNPGARSEITDPLISSDHTGDWVDVNIPVRVSIVIPTLNEAENLRHLLPTLPKGLHEVIIVDGHSTDGTVDVAREIIPDVKVVQQTRKGKGNALAHGFAACTGDIIAMLDADGSADPSEMTLFITALLNGADFVKGSRYSAGGGSTDLTGIRSIGNFWLNQMVNGLYGTRFSDLCYGYNVFWRHCLPFIGLDELVEAGPEQPVWGDGFEVETLMITRVAKAGLRVVEVPSIEYERVHGETHLRTFTDGTRVLRTALVERLQPMPPRADLQLREVTSGSAAQASIAVVTVIDEASSIPNLQFLLASLDSQTRVPGEVVVVVDGDEDLLAQVQQAVPGRTVVPNTHRAGNAGAVNAGFASTTGQLVMTIDVNAVPRPNWVERMAETLENNDDVAVVGGRTTTLWESGRPSWFPPEMDWAVGGTYRGMPRKIHEIRDPYGGNAAYRRSVFEEVGGLPESPDGPEFSREETELAIRIGHARPSARILYLPDAVIQRKVTAAESTWHHLRSRCTNEGISKAIVADRVGAGDATSRERGYVARVLSRAAVEGVLESVMTGKTTPIRRSGVVVAGLGASSLSYARQRARSAVRSSR